MSDPEVGGFRQGSPMSQWALGRYLVGRALAESADAALLVLAVALLVLAAVSEWTLHSALLATLLVLVMIGVLLLRWVLLAIVRRLTDLRQFGPVEARMSDLVRDTRSDVRRELRRIGLPGRLLTMPLLLFALIGRHRRRRTLERLRQFDTSRVVTPARLDEMHLLLQGDQFRPPEK